MIVEILKRVALAVAALAATVSLAAADDAPSWLKAPLKKPLDQLVIGLSFPLLDPWGATYESSFIAYAKELGVKVVVLDSQADVPKQRNDIRDLVAQGVSFYGSVLMQPDDASRLALKTAIEVAEGQPVAKEQYYDTPPYTLKNIDQTPVPTY
jgi:ABC-type xylose transport system substrate-binding protein